MALAGEERGRVHALQAQRADHPAAPRHGTARGRAGSPPAQDVEDMIAHRRAVLRSGVARARAPRIAAPFRPLSPHPIASRTSIAAATRAPGVMRSPRNRRARARHVACPRRSVPCEVADVSWSGSSFGCRHLIATRASRRQSGSRFGSPHPSRRNFPFGRPLPPCVFVLHTGGLRSTGLRHDPDIP